MVPSRGRDRLVWKGISSIHVLLLIIIVVVAAAAAENTVGVDEGVHCSGAPPPPSRN